MLTENDWLELFSSMDRDEVVFFVRANLRSDRERAAFATHVAGLTLPLLVATAVAIMAKRAPCPANDHSARPSGPRLVAPSCYVLVDLSACRKRVAHH